MRPLIALFLALALVGATCGSDDDTAATTTEPDPSTTTAPDADAPELASSCTSPDGFTISYPSDWDAVSDCGQFGPAPVEEPEPATDERPGVVSAYVDPVPFEEATVSDEHETARETTTVDGLRAVRVASTASGEGLYPEGTETVRWVVDLPIGSDGDPRTLFLGAVDVHDDVDFDQAVVVMDAMARTLDIEVGDEARPPGG